ncbi:hypothetical protein VP1G_10219 [Cytospora mali]|uniref:Cleavage/polyadenylation specificity factor A subunit N-terminal domain-containing protein n=1 Tax=Cytospora mali TaxID=578113 RepID=A0A194VGF8_CYTMA|nr:hypothetical protein VP1G_10219 [Valsa mali var. pyri (nom. inval.)]
MAAQFQSHVLENGQWVTRTTNVDDILSKPTMKPTKQIRQPPPQCGIMTRTVVESPVAHWIIPVRLRSPQHNDIAFVGDHYVQISELRHDLQLHSIVKKKDFGSRIRNAKALGTFSRDDIDANRFQASKFHSKSEDDDFDVDMSDVSAPASSINLPRLPPQLLLIILETGDCIFLFLRPDKHGAFEFVVLQHDLHSSRLVRPGFHLAVDPSSRYMAQACSRNIFVVHELESMSNLNNSFIRGQQLRPIISSRARTVNGVIHTMEFLYPRPQDPQHIILLLIVVNRGVPRLITYDWELGDDLREALSAEKVGHRLPQQHEMPLLIIPLTIRTAFFAVSEGEIAFCKDVLHGAPSFEPSAFLVGTFGNVSTAFASLAHHNDDILIFGGDSGLGGTPPREKVTRLSQIPNWSPTVDFVTTNESNRWDNHDGATGKTRQRRDIDPVITGFSQPDRIFAAAGRGKNASIVEYRHGLQANIGVEFDFGTVVKRCFMLLANVADPVYGHHLLLSVPGRSALLHIPSDFLETFDVEQHQTPYDLSSPTLVATQLSQETIVQVTESGVVFVSPSTSTQFAFSALGVGDAVVTDATLKDDLLAVTSHTDSDSNIHIIKLDVQNLQAAYLYKEELNGEVACLSLCSIGGKMHVVAGLWWNNAVYLDFWCIPERKHVKMVTTQSLTENLLQNDLQKQVADSIEPFTSIVSVVEDTENTVLIAGSRDGVLMTLSLGNQCQELSVHFEKLGSVPAHVYAARDDSAFVCCDSSLVLISDFQQKKQGFAQKQSVWTVDANDSSKSSPNITSVMVLRESLSGNDANLPLLLLATDHVLLAELQPQTGPVQRHIPLGMTPQKLLYSHVLKCIVVAVKTPDDRPSLMFIDPDTGCDLSFPVKDHNREPMKYINGLGQQGDRILCLEEWHVSSDTGSFYYILVSTRGAPGGGGRVLVVSTKQEKPPLGESRGRILNWTRHRIKGPKEPAYAAGGNFDSVQAVLGSTLVHYRLDREERKLKDVSTFDLGSPAWKVTFAGTSLNTLALTKLDSLKVLKEDEDGRNFTVSHVDPVARPAIDMIEVAGTWPSSPQPMLESEPGSSIVILADQNSGLTGLWIPWDCPDKDCEVLFEADIPSTVRRLRLGRTLPAWSQGARRDKRFGLLPASVNDAEILGMGIDGSLQSFTLLDLRVWYFLRFLQNIAETSAELYPFTYLRFETIEEEEAYDPRPVVDNSLQMQVDGDLMQRVLDKRALEGLVWTRHEWVGYFLEYLDGVDGGRWTRFENADEEERVKSYCRLAYDILEYFLMPAL